jgi:hypothetical protein
MAIIHEGRVLRTGRPQAAIEEMKGRTWKKVIPKAELPRYQADFMVISLRMTGGQTVIHVYAEHQPDPTFVEVAPDLQDVYFRTLSGTGNGG